MIINDDITKLFGIISAIPRTGGDLLKSLELRINELLQSILRNQNIEELIKSMLTRGYFLDINSSKSGRLYYLGRVIESREVNLTASSFLFCASNQENCYGCPYPQVLQKDDSQVYSNGNTTWFDLRKPIKYTRPGEIPSKLERLSIERLKELKKIGEQNYQKLKCQ